MNEVVDREGLPAARAPEHRFAVGGIRLGVIEESWLELDFGQIRPVGRLRILWWQRDEASWTIGLSRDREIWETVAENKADKHQVLCSGQDHEFSPITFVGGLNVRARYLRVKARGEAPR